MFIFGSECHLKEVQCTISKSFSVAMQGKILKLKGGLET
jgi:hypothetical protein